VEYYERRNDWALFESRGCDCMDYDSLTWSIGWEFRF